MSNVVALFPSTSAPDALRDRIVIFLNSDDGGWEPQTTLQICSALKVPRDLLDFRNALGFLQQFGYIKDVSDDGEDALWVAMAVPNQ